MNERNEVDECFAFTAFVAHHASATELWSCYITHQAAKEPMLAAFEVTNKHLVQTWATGMKFDYQIAQNNRYGLVGFSSISEIEPGQSDATIGASTVVINRATREIWLTTVVAGQQRTVNEGNYQVDVP